MGTPMFGNTRMLDFGDVFSPRLDIGNNEFVRIPEAGKVAKVPVAFWGRVLTNKVERAWFEKCYYETFWGVWWLLLWTLKAYWDYWALIDVCEKNKTLCDLTWDFFDMDMLDKLWPFAEFLCMYRKKSRAWLRTTERRKSIPRVSCVKSASSPWWRWSLFLKRKLQWFAVIQSPIRETNHPSSHMTQYLFFFFSGVCERLNLQCW